MKLNAKQLRSHQPSAISHQTLKKAKKNEIYIILDNVLDTYNIGSVFRLADAVNAKKIYLCAGSETPPNHRIKKASINTMEIVEWEYFEKTTDAIKDLRFKNKDIRIIAVEQSEKSVPYDKYDYSLPIALVVGHESDGVSKEVLDLCDGIVELPMLGVNVSLNVMVSLGIVLYKVVEKTGL
ncbi:MAG: TrmH family RNA methyltransferase [Candidatus Daviesbacteria bacterium]|nr:TrmH family RNA methyltransferase [Candidatus Daviesbacteria bacterium]